jgi:uncharacterized protein (DUF362 family)/NAD-dependent dihydropyrimidine dehydrogenase PreA subunit
LNTQVIINKCDTYDIAEVGAVIRTQLASIGADETLFAGKKVVIKPNLVVPVSPEKCTTTHPSIVEAAARYISQMGGTVTIAESPGGPYVGSLLNRVYKITGMADAAGKSGAALNYDVTSRPFNAPHAVTSHYFDVITPVYDADVIVSISKLKTHTLTILSAAVKNLFGVVPGVGKFGIHARYKDQDDFQSALVDLTSALCETKPVISIVDAVDAMEGNGPSGGSPRHVGCIISGRNPFTVDLLCAEIIGVPGEVKMLDYAAERGLCPPSAGSLRLTGDDINIFKITDYKKPDTRRSEKFRHLPRFLSPRPVIDPKKCVGCVKCYESCPAKTIAIKYYNGKKKAEINDKNCIRCFCCQELCPSKAVYIKKNIIFRLIPKL